jgi:Uma2 family endonuclease
MPAIELGVHAVIPAWVVDHESFCRWALSDEYPERGQFSYLGDRVWVDVEMEAEDHNELKLVIGAVLLFLVRRRKIGRYFADRMALKNSQAGLSTEPDGMFVSTAARRAGRAVVREGRPERKKGLVVEGTPDMVLEVVSPNSVRKDTVELLELYWHAGIPEYWLVDPRGNEPRWTLYTHTPRGYRAVRPVAGWRKSAVFGASFRLVQTLDDFDLPEYTLETR